MTLANHYEFRSTDLDDGGRQAIHGILDSSSLIGSAEATITLNGQDCTEVKVDGTLWGFSIRGATTGRGTTQAFVLVPTANAELGTPTTVPGLAVVTIADDDTPPHDPTPMFFKATSLTITASVVQT